MFSCLVPFFALADNPANEKELYSSSLAPKINSWETESGVKAMMFQVDSIPVIDIAIDIDAGSRWDPVGLEGLSSMTNSMIFKGLSKFKNEPHMTEEEILQFIAKMAMVKSSSNGKDRTSLRFRFLSDDEIRKPITKFIAHTLSFPEFNEDILEREKNFTISRLEESLTKPQSLATRNLWKLMYPDHPYGRSISVDSVRSITKNGLKSFHQTFWIPKRMTISIVGDIDINDAKKLVNGITESIPNESITNDFEHNIEFPLILPAVTKGGSSTKRISHPAGQSHIWIGLPILARHETDNIFPMLVANHILGGSGFGSRLTEEIREKRGLSYSVFSAFRLLKQEGPFFVALQTGKNNADVAIQVVSETLREFIKKGPTTFELENAKKGLIGGFALRLDSNFKLLENLSQIAFYDLPLDYLENWTLRVQAVTLADVKKVLIDKLDLNNLSLVVVGNKD